MGNVEDVYKSDEGNCLFTKQFDFWEQLEREINLPAYMERLNKIENDRSYVILAVSIVELQIDQFLEAFIPNKDVLVFDKTPISAKIKIIEAFGLIPHHFHSMLKNIIRIRNIFAHNPIIDDFSDAYQLKELNQAVIDMQTLWNRFSENMVYWNNNEPLRLMYKDICLVCIEGLRVFESNIKLFRQETEKKEFIDHLDLLSTELRKKREAEEKDSIRKNWSQ